MSRNNGAECVSLGKNSLRAIHAFDDDIEVLI